MSIKMFRNIKAQGVLIFLLITVAMLLLLYLSLSTLGSVLSSYSAKSTIYTGFSDIANSLANDVVSIVVFLPHGAEITYNKIIPMKIGGATYTVRYNPNTECIILEVLSAPAEYNIIGYTTSINISGLRWEGDISIYNSSAEIITIRVGR
jgi:hypothetical protein